MKPTHGNWLTDFLHLIRLPNLLIVAMTMILMRYSIIRPILNAITVEIMDGLGVLAPMALQTKWFDFIILVLSTVCITAGGYVINDYFDIRTDIINRGSIIVGNTISRRKAMMYHNIFNILGVVGGFYVAWRIHYFWLGVLFLIVSGLLYFYSVTYKRQFLIGNIVVALMTAMVPLLVVLFEATPVFRYYSVSTVSFPGVSLLFFWVGGFALFAFLTTLIREIIKDLEDFEGDSTFGRNTLPIVAGTTATKIIVEILSAVTLFLLYLIWYLYMPDYLTLGYITIFICIPFIYVGIKVIKSESREDLHKASRIVKIIMLAGILYSVVAGIIITTGNFTR